MKGTVVCSLLGAGGAVTHTVNEQEAAAAPRRKRRFVSGAPSSVSAQQVRPSPSCCHAQGQDLLFQPRLTLRR